jgi:hypothetical protein
MMQKRTVAIAIAMTTAAALATLALATLALAQQPPQRMPGHDMKQHQMPASDAPAKPPLGPSDERQAIALTAGERDFVLHEMRRFLQSVQGIVSALADDKPAAAATQARSSGMAGTHDVPRELMRKMPPEWRMLGMDTHQKFDTFALEADGIGDRKQLLGQLAGILANCTGCHAGYRLVAP